MVHGESENSIGFCPKCGGRLEEQHLEHDYLPRMVCRQCGFIFYQNPKLVAGTIPLINGKCVLLRRGIPPQKGAWTFPGGFVDLGETVEEAALRETWEETNLDVVITSLLNVYSRPERGVVIVVYLAKVVGGQAQTSREAEAIGYFSSQEVPWDELAFESTQWVMRDWVRRGIHRPESQQAAAIPPLAVPPQAIAPPEPGTVDTTA